MEFINFDPKAGKTSAMTRTYVVKDDFIFQVVDCTKLYLRSSKKAKLHIGKGILNSFYFGVILKALQTIG